MSVFMIKNGSDGTSRIRRLTSYIPLGLIGVALLVFLSPFFASAITSMSQGFLTSEKLSLGSIVSLENNSTDHVVAASTSTTDNIIGVVINSSNSLITISNGQEDQVQIATSGMAAVLVSDINGEITQGDQITSSPIKGVGMKATGNTKVIGIAQGSPTGTSEQNYKDESGNQQTVVLGEIPVLVAVAYYYKTPEKTIIPQALQNLANALAGKTVSSLPIIISAGIFIIALIVVVSIVYSMIRSSIISVGRNPMSQSAVYRDVIQLSALVLAILAVAIIAIYLILTRL